MIYSHNTAYESLDDRAVHSGYVERWQWHMYYFDSVVSQNTGSIPSFTIVVNQTQTNEGTLLISNSIFLRDLLINRN